MPLGTSFSLQLEKEAKEPRLSGICCKSTFYPLSALRGRVHGREVLMFLQHFSGLLDACTV